MNIQIKEVIQEFHNKQYDVKCGVYKVNIDGEVKILVRHNDNVKTIAFSDKCSALWGVAWRLEEGLLKILDKK